MTDNLEDVGRVRIEHEHCIAVTRNNAGEIVKCISCHAERVSLGSGWAWLQDTPAWDKLDGALNPSSDIDTEPEDQVMSDAVREDNDLAINDSERDHLRPSLPWNRRKAGA